MAEPENAQPKLTWEEVGFVCEGFSFAALPLLAATKTIMKRYDLGERGAWIVVLIKAGIVYPLDFAQVFRVGRSLISFELSRLTEAGLIVSRQAQTDRRRTELALSAEGEVAFEQIAADMTALVTERLAGYTREEILLCGRMLRDMRSGQPERLPNRTPLEG